MMDLLNLDIRCNCQVHVFVHLRWLTTNSFYEARARVTIRLPDVNIACTRKTLQATLKETKTSLSPLFES